MVVEPSRVAPSSTTPSTANSSVTLYIAMAVFAIARSCGEISGGVCRPAVAQ